MDDIAVIGLGLRFPGDASSPEALWKVLEEGASQWSEIPKDRLNINGYYHPGGERQGSISFKGAHFLKDNVANFDAPFFSIAAADAKAIDPQQRLLLEVCYEALENAGCTKDEIDGTNTSVYVGSFVKDYEQICLRDPDWQPQYAATGNGIAIMANRISYFFNLHGPSMTIDTGCSGSLVSVHLAAQSLRTGESSLAIAAGAGLILTPNTIMPMTALNFLSPDGKCFTFDARANGYGRGEGVGVVILKRMSDAIRDNDTIRAVIRGTHVNQDGRTTGITLPSKEAQVANIRAVYKVAGLPHRDTAYVECHGTGTQAGDWRELKAISETLGASRTADSPIFVGSVKPNIGHLEGAAGVAGLIKAVLMLERQRIPPHTNFETPNPDIDFQDWKVQVSRIAQDWPPNLKRRISVNCFGFGGTNAHVILDGAQEYLSEQQLLAHHSSSSNMGIATENDSASSTDGLQVTEPCSWQLLCFSSNERSGIQRIRAQHMFMLENHGCQEIDFLPNYAYTLGCRRSQLEWKSFFVAQSVSNLISQMKEPEILVRRSTKEYSPKLCFLFSGQGSQWARMGSDLQSFPVFLNSLNSASWYLKTVLGSSYDLMDEIYRDTKDSQLSDPHISQPATTAIQIALVDLMQSLMIEPDFVLGHSSGEIAAAVACGAISREEAWEIAYYRGLAASQLQTKLPGFRGGMIAVSMTLYQATSYISTLSEPLEIACVNSPNSITLSGKREIIEQVSLDLSAQGIRHHVLSVTMAYHSSYMKKVEDEYVHNIVSISPSRCRKAVRMFSSVTGDEIECARLDAGYWGKNMVSTVQFASGLESLMALTEDQQPSLFIEMGPSTVLRAPVMDTLSPRVKEDVYFSALDQRRPGMASVLGIVGELWAFGYNVNVKSTISRRIPQPRLKCLPHLPSYPWNHSKSYWHESHLSLANRFREYGRLDLIGAPTADSVSFEPRWRGFLRISENPWIQDHQVQKAVIYPAAGMISMVLEGARQLRSSFPDIIGYEIRNMQFIKAIVIPDTTHGVEIALNMRAEASAHGESPKKGQFTFSIYSKNLERAWERNATGALHFCSHSSNWEILFRAFSGQHEDIATMCRTSVDPRQLYEHLDSVGITYGPMFRNILEVKKGTDCCISRVRVPDTESTMPANFEYPHLLHPGTLDAMFQTLFALKPTPRIPYFIQSIFVSDSLDLSSSREFAGYATAKQRRIDEAEAQLSMCCTDRPLDQIIVKGLQFSGELFSPSTGSSFLPNYRNLATELIWRENPETADFESFRHMMSLLCHRYPQLSVLQIGGTPLLAKCILLSASGVAIKPLRLGRYTLVDENQSDPFFNEINVSPFSNYLENLSDITLVHSKYHLIVVNELQQHEISQTKSFLRPGGIILQVRPGDAFLRDSIPRPGTEYLSSGWHLTDLHKEWCNHTGVSSSGSTDDSMQFSLQRSPLAGAKWTMPASVILLLPSSVSEEVSHFKAQFIKHLTTQHPETTICALHLKDTANSMLVRSDALFISLLDFCPSVSDGGAIFNWKELDFKAFHTLQKTMKTVVWVTRGANMVPVNPRSSSVIGLARTLMSEDMQISFATFDLDQHSVLYEPGLMDMFLTVCRNVVDPAIANEVHEVEFAEKDGKLFIPRLETLNYLNDIIEESKGFDISSEKCFQTEEIEVGRLIDLEPSVPSRMLSRTPGSPIYFKEFELEHSDPLEITISFSSGVLYGRSAQTSDEMSSKCCSYDVAGTVASVGECTSQYHKGDKVLALVPDGKGLRTAVRVDSAFVMQYRPGFVPSHFLSAYYALFNVGRLRTGNTVLIHSGTSGFGIAAVELSLLVGATVFTTVVGPNADKQIELLNRRGIEVGHILDGNSDNYTSVVDFLTGHRGVDIVYNPTRKDIPLSTACVRRCGTVVYLTDSSENIAIVAPPGIPVTIVSFDMDTLLTEYRDLSIEILHEVAQLTNNASLDWLSDSAISRQFDISALGDALNDYRRHPHAGYVLITADSSQAYGGIVRVIDLDPIKSLRECIAEDATYVLVGGLGGLGTSIAELLVTNGAKNIAFISRSGASSTGSSQFLEMLTRLGVDARAFAVDICDQAALQALLRNELNAAMPPICGVFHCAAVIKDAVFDNMTYEHWNTGFKPKALGAWNLVEAVKATGQDPFFVFLASSAGVIGTRGQANYAAGNVVLDALARSLQLQGKRAISLDLGPILGAGMVANDAAILDILRASGFYGIRHNDFLTVIKHAIMLETFKGRRLPPQIILGVGTGGLMLQNQPADPYWSRTAIYSCLNIIDMPPPDLTAPMPYSGLDIKSQLRNCADTDLAAGIVRSGLSSMLAKSMNMATEEIDPSRPPSAYGVDSLVAVGVRNWVAGNCGVDVSVLEIMSNLTILELSKAIVKTRRLRVEIKKH